VRSGVGESGDELVQLVLRRKRVYTSLLFTANGFTCSEVRWGRKVMGPDYSAWRSDEMHVIIDGSLLSSPLMYIHLSTA